MSPSRKSPAASLRSSQSGVGAALCRRTPQAHFFPAACFASYSFQKSLRHDRPLLDKFAVSFQPRVMKPILRLFSGILLTFTASAETLIIAGSGTVTKAITPAVEEFKKATGMEVSLRPLPSAKGIFAVAQGQAQIGLTIEDVSDAQRQLFSSVNFHSTKVGRGAIYLLVSPDVWDAGVHALSRDQMLSVIENKGMNWAAFGGPDQPIKFVSPAGGSLANFATWLHGKTTPEHEAKIKSRTVIYNENGGFAHSKYIGEGHGVLAVLSEWFLTNESKAHKLAISTPEGSIDPSTQNIGSGRYPMSFDLQLITNGPPQEMAKQFIDFLLSEKGQALIESQGYVHIQASAQKLSK